MMEYTEESRAIIWLCTKSNTEYSQQKVLLDDAQINPVTLFREWEKVYPSVIKNADKRVYKSTVSQRERETDEAIAELNAAGCFAVTRQDADFPELLKHVTPNVYALFGKGNRALLNKRKFCIVGSRTTPPWAEKQAKIISQALSSEVAVVTGFAEGGDRAAIDGALASGNLICVLPLGLDGCYPARHASLKEQVAKKGLLLSEYPLGTKLRKHHFHARNRILVGLSEGVLVVSGKLDRSGAMITAKIALDHGRDVYAFPYSLGQEVGTGCNHLIKNGAYLVSEIEDITYPCGITIKKEKPQLLDENEQKILRLLKEKGELHVAQIADFAQMPVYEVAAHLSSLEMKNLAVKAGGNRYSAV